jgi:hypothetical protein
MLVLLLLILIMLAPARPDCQLPPEPPPLNPPNPQPACYIDWRWPALRAASSPARQDFERDYWLKDVAAVVVTVN